MVSVGPYGVPGLDFFAGSILDRQEVAWVQQGEQAVVEHMVPDLMSWIDTFNTGEPPEGMTDWVHRMLVQTLQEALAPGPGGVVDDYRSWVQPWGFDIADVAAPTRIMIASEDETVPAAHGQWLADHIPGAQTVTVPGGHFGPRDKEEEQLIAWLASREA